VTMKKNGDYGNQLKNALRISLKVGFTVGSIEALIIAIRVLASNTWNLDLFAGLIKFISVAVTTFALFVVVGGVLMSQMVRILPQKDFAAANGKLWILRFCWFWSFAFLFGVWANYNTIDRYPLSIVSLLYDLAAVIGAALLAILAARLTKKWATAPGFYASGNGRVLMFGWLSLLALAFIQAILFPIEPARSCKPNVVLLIVDTLRADRLGCYGYDKPTSPNIDAVASEGVLFENTYVQWASSLPSHASIMTSTYPHVHGAFPNGKILNPNLPTLAKILKEHGYTNGAFVTNSLVGIHYNFQFGFDTFIDQADFDYRNTTMAAWVHSLNLFRVFDHLTNNDLFTELALSWLRKNQSKPFFLWMQWLYPHAPYKPPAKFLEPFAKPYHGIANGTMPQIELINKKKLVLSPEDEAHYSALYDGEVLISDYQIGRILEELRTLSLLDNSIVIVTADHGENLNEHGMEYGHYGVYDSSVRIPLIFSKPPLLPPGKRVSEVVQSIDIAPTLLDLLSIPRPEEFQGRSMRPLIFEDHPKWESVAHSVMFREDVNFLSSRNGEWKINLKVRDDQNIYELYHIPSDPQELNNRVESEPAIADSLKHLLAAWIENNFHPSDLVYVPGTYFKEDFDKATIERLRALGYIK